MLNRPWLMTALCLLCPGPSQALAVFGFDFDVEVPAERLGATYSLAPALLLKAEEAPRGATEATASRSWDAEGYWHSARSQAIPPRLTDTPIQLRLALDRTGHPFWLQLTGRRPNCQEDLRWLRAALARRYGKSLPTETRTLSFNGEPFQSVELRYAGESLSIASACAGDALYVEYRKDDRLLAAYRRNDQMLREASVARSTDRPHLEHRLRSLLLGDRSSLQRLLGFTLQADAATTLPPGEPHQVQPSASRVTDPLLAQFVSNADHQLTTDGLGGVLRLESVGADPGKRLLRELDAMLRVMLGAASKSTPFHKIYRVGAQRLILRWHKGQLHLIYRDLERGENEEKRLVAAEQARFEESARGL